MIWEKASLPETTNQLELKEYNSAEVICKGAV